MNEKVYSIIKNSEKRLRKVKEQAKRRKEIPITEEVVSVKKIDFNFFQFLLDVAYSSDTNKGENLCRFYEKLFLERNIAVGCFMLKRLLVVTTFDNTLKTKLLRCKDVTEEEENFIYTLFSKNKKDGIEFKRMSDNYDNKGIIIEVADGRKSALLITTFTEESIHDTKY